MALHWFSVLLSLAGMAMFLREAVSARKVVFRVLWAALVVLLGAWLVFALANGYLVNG